MQKRLLTICTLLFGAFIFLSNSGNPPNRKTGAPLDGICSECHTGNNAALDGDITLTGIPNEAIPGMTYPITVTLTNPNGVAAGGGFQWVAIKGDLTNAGNISDVSTGTAIVNSGGRQYHEHSTQHSFSSGEITWTADWTAPNGTFGEEISFYSIGVIGNGSGSANDRVSQELYTTTIGQNTTSLTITLDNQTDALCFESEDGSAEVGVSGGNPPFSYSWSNGETSNPATALPAGVHSVTVTDSANESATVSVTIGDGPELSSPNYDLSSDIICINSSDGEIEIIESSILGTPPYTYQWNNGDNSSFISDLSAGDYQCTITDSNGCTVESEVISIEELELPVTISGISTICSGVETTLTVAEGYEFYSWNNGEITQSATYNQGGAARVTVTDSQGCTSSQTVTITEIDAVSVSILGDSGICSSGQMNELTLNTTFTAANWSTGEQGQSITIDTCGTYTVTATDFNGCVSTDEIVVSCISSPEIVLEIATPPSCNGNDDGMIQVSSTDNSQVNYVWSTGATGISIDNLATGVYSVTATNPTGCSSTETYTLTQPDTLGLVIDTLITPVCHGDTNAIVKVNATGGTAPYVFQWPNGQITDSLSTLGSGDYVVKILDANQCLDSAIVTVPNVLPLQITADSIVNINCNGDNTGSIAISVLGGHGSYSYTWNTGANTQDITNLTAGLYTVTVSDWRGCSVQAEYLISQNQPIMIDADIIGQSQAGVNDGSIAVTVTGGISPYTYAWSNGQTTATIANLAPGEYNVTVTDDIGCALSTSYFVNSANCTLSLVATANAIECFGDNTGSIVTEVSGGLGPYVITVNGMLNNLTNLAAGTYLVDVSDAGGCNVSKTIEIIQPTELMATLTVTTPPSCTNSLDGNVSLNVEGGTPPYTYMWSDGFDGLQHIIQSGQIGITVTDVNDCETTIDTTIMHQDNESPIIALKNATIYLDSFGIVELPNPIVFDNGSTDNCGVLNWAYANDFTIDCSMTELPVAISIADNDGNIAIDTALLTIADTIAPVIDCPQSLTVNSCDFTTIEGLSIWDNCQAELPYTVDYDNIELPLGGNQQVTVTTQDEFGNEASCTVDVTFDINTDINIDASAIVCSGDLSQLTIDINGDNGPYTTLVNNEAPNDEYPAGFYYINITDSNGCEFEQQLVITEPDAILVTVEEIVASTGSTPTGSIDVSIEGGATPYNVVYTLGQNTISEGIEDVTNIDAGDYVISVYDANDCVTTIEVTVPLQTSTLDEAAQRIILAPNPGNDFIHIYGIDLQDTQTDIYTINGTYVQSNVGNMVDVSKLETGVYIVRIQFEGKTIVKRWSKL